jgi:sulfatase modifying factor 1
MMTGTRSCTLVTLGVHLAMSGCHRGESIRPDPFGSDDRWEAGPGDAEAGASSKDPPAPKPGWTEQRDGIACRHPDVKADCEGGWCRIPAGCFVMGSPETEWNHPAYTENQVAVLLTHDFVIGQYEVTQGEWTAKGLLNPSGPFPPRPDGGVVIGDPDADRSGGDCIDDPKCPVGNVTWFEAVQFANLLSAAHSPALSPCYALEGCTGDVGTGMKCTTVSLTAPTVYDCEGYRLPTDAEWEYATRAGTRTAFYSGDITPQADFSSCYEDLNLDAIAWYCVNSRRLTHPVGQKLPNAWWLYDTLGNAQEWSNDFDFGAPNPSGPLRNPGDNFASQRPERRRRGGVATGWSPLLRAASTVLGLPWYGRINQLGFRLARTLPADRDSGESNAGHVDGDASK